MSVLIAHPGVGPFVRANVEALFEYSLLDRFATTVVDDPAAGWQRLVSWGGPLTRSVRRLVQRRQPPNVPRERIVTHPFREIVRASVSRFDRAGVWTDRAWDWAAHDFAAWAGRCLRPGTRAVFGSEYNSLEMFDVARSRGLPRVLELPSAEHDFVAATVARERERAGGIERDAYAQHTDALREERTRRRRKEVELATLVIVNSPFARETYANAGYPVDRFVVLPLGAPELTPVEREPRSTDLAPLRLAWGGNFAWHKGAAVLVDALSSFGDRTDIRLDVYGQVHLPAACLERLPPWVTLHGAVPRATFLELLATSDVLVHPSLSDGFAMVVSEAMALGVAPIVSTATGASALVCDGESGRIVPAGDVAALRDALAWCLANRARLHAMGAAARSAAARWTWRDYGRAFAGIIVDHVGR